MKKKAFTLLELLIVIIIIGLLAAIGLVQYNRAVTNAKNAAAKAMLGEMKKVAQAYQAVNNAWPNGAAFTVTLPDGEESIAFSGTDNFFTYNAISASGTGTATPTGANCSGCTAWTINFATGEIGAADTSE